MRQYSVLLCVSGHLLIDNSKKKKKFFFFVVLNLCTLVTFLKDLRASRFPVKSAHQIHRCVHGLR